MDVFTIKKIMPRPLSPIIVARAGGALVSSS